LPLYTVKQQSSAAPRTIAAMTVAKTGAMDAVSFAVGLPSAARTCTGTCQRGFTQQSRKRVNHGRSVAAWKLQFTYVSP
jgi:hypothetical protein